MCIEGLHGLRHVAMSCDNLYCNFFILGASEYGASMEWSVYCQSLSAVARTRYESKVLQAGLGIVSYSIDYLTPAVLYFARNRQMVQERTLHIRSHQAPDNAATIDVLHYPYALPPM